MGSREGGGTEVRRGVRWCAVKGGSAGECGRRVAGGGLLGTIARYCWSGQQCQ